MLEWARAQEDRTFDAYDKHYRAWVAARGGAVTATGIVPPERFSVQPDAEDPAHPGPLKWTKAWQFDTQGHRFDEYAPTFVRMLAQWSDTLLRLRPLVQARVGLAERAFNASFASFRTDPVVPAFNRDTDSPTEAVSAFLEYSLPFEHHQALLTLTHQYAASAAALAHAMLYVFDKMVSRQPDDTDNLDGLVGRTAGWTQEAVARMRDQLRQIIGGGGAHGTALAEQLQHDPQVYLYDYYDLAIHRMLAAYRQLEPLGGNADMLYNYRLSLSLPKTAQKEKPTEEVAKLARQVYGGWFYGLKYVGNATKADQALLQHYKLAILKPIEAARKVADAEATADEAAKIAAEAAAEAANAATPEARHDAMEAAQEATKEAEEAAARGAALSTALGPGDRELLQLWTDMNAIRKGPRPTSMAAMQAALALYRNASPLNKSRFAAVFDDHYGNEKTFSLFYNGEPNDTGVADMIDRQSMTPAEELAFFRRDYNPTSLLATLTDLFALGAPEARPIVAPDLSGMFASPPHILHRPWELNRVVYEHTLLVTSGVVPDNFVIRIDGPTAKCPVWLPAPWTEAAARLPTLEGLSLAIQDPPYDNKRLASAKYNLEETGDGENLVTMNSPLTELALRSALHAAWLALRGHMRSIFFDGRTATRTYTRITDLLTADGGSLQRLEAKQLTRYWRIFRIEYKMVAELVVLFFRVAGPLTNMFAALGLDDGMEANAGNFFERDPMNLPFAQFVAAHARLFLHAQTFADKCARIVGSVSVHGRCILYKMEDSTRNPSVAERDDYLVEIPATRTHPARLVEPSPTDAALRFLGTEQEWIARAQTLSASITRASFEGDAKMQALLDALAVPALPSPRRVSSASTLRLILRVVALTEQAAFSKFFDHLDPWFATQADIGVVDRAAFLQTMQVPPKAERQSYTDYLDSVFGMADMVYFTPWALMFNIPYDLYSAEIVGVPTLFEDVFVRRGMAVAETDEERAALVAANDEATLTPELVTQQFTYVDINGTASDVAVKFSLLKYPADARVDVYSAEFDAMDYASELARRTVTLVFSIGDVKAKLPPTPLEVFGYLDPELVETLRLDVRPSVEVLNAPASLKAAIDGYRGMRARGKTYMPANETFANDFKFSTWSFNTAYLDWLLATEASGATKNTAFDAYVIFYMYLRRLAHALDDVYAEERVVYQDFLNFIDDGIYQLEAASKQKKQARELEAKGIVERALKGFDAIVPYSVLAYSSAAAEMVFGYRDVGDSYHILASDKPDTSQNEEETAPLAGPPRPWLEDEDRDDDLFILARSDYEASEGTDALHRIATVDGQARKVVSFYKIFCLALNHLRLAGTLPVSLSDHEDRWQALYEEYAANEFRRKLRRLSKFALPPPQSAARVFLAANTVDAGVFAKFKKASKAFYEAYREYNKSARSLVDDFVAPGSAETADENVKLLQACEDCLAANDAISSEEWALLLAVDPKRGRLRDAAKVMHHGVLCDRTLEYLMLLLRRSLFKKTEDGVRDSGGAIRAPELWTQSSATWAELERWFTLRQNQYEKLTKNEEYLRRFPRTLANEKAWTYKYYRDFTTHFASKFFGNANAPARAAFGGQLDALLARIGSNDGKYAYKDIMTTGHTLAEQAFAKLLGTRFQDVLLAAEANWLATKLTMSVDYDEKKGKNKYGGNHGKLRTAALFIDRAMLYYRLGDTLERDITGALPPVCTSWDLANGTVYLPVLEIAENRKKLESEMPTYYNPREITKDELSSLIQRVEPPASVPRAPVPKARKPRAAPATEAVMDVDAGSSAASATPKRAKTTTDGVKLHVLAAKLSLDDVEAPETALPVFADVLFAAALSQIYASARMGQCTAVLVPTDACWARCMTEHQSANLRYAIYTDELVRTLKEATMYRHTSSADAIVLNPVASTGVRLELDMPDDNDVYACALQKMRVIKNHPVLPARTIEAYGTVAPEAYIVGTNGDDTFAIDEALRDPAFKEEDVLESRDEPVPLLVVQVDFDTLDPSELGAFQVMQRWQHISKLLFDLQSRYHVVLAHPPAEAAPRPRPRIRTSIVNARAMVPATLTADRFPSSGELIKASTTRQAANPLILPAKPGVRPLGQLATVVPMPEVRAPAPYPPADAERIRNVELPPMPATLHDLTRHRQVPLPPVGGHFTVTLGGKDIPFAVSSIDIANHFFTAGSVDGVYRNIRFVQKQTGNVLAWAPEKL